MVHVGLDLSRKKIDVCALSPAGEKLLETNAPPTPEGLARLVASMASMGSITAVIESMTGARFVHDTLEAMGWDVKMADARKAKGLAPLACKTDKIDAEVLARLSLHDLVPEVWLPSDPVRKERERARYRIFLVHRRSQLKNRIHATLIQFQEPCPGTDICGVRGKAVMKQMDIPDPWKGNMLASLRLIDDLNREIGTCEAELKTLGLKHAYMPQLMTIPGIGPILAYTIASEIGDITRFATPRKLVGYTGLSPRVIQSGEKDWRGPLTKTGPKYLRWALIAAATHACHHPAYEPHYNATIARLGQRRGPKVARIEVARKLAAAIWMMLSHHTEFAPASPTKSLAA